MGNCLATQVRKNRGGGYSSGGGGYTYRGTNGDWVGDSGGASVYGVGASVYGVGARVYGSLVILVSAQGPNPSFFLFIRLGGLLGPGFGPGLDNYFHLAVLLHYHN